MSLLPEEAGFLEHVQAFFLAFRGDGVALSPLDAELLVEWHSRGIPYPVVCRGIRKAAESLLYHEGENTRVRTLRSCRLAVEREFHRWEGTSTVPLRPPEEPLSSPTQSFAIKRLKKVRALLRKASREASPPASRGIEAATSVVSMKIDDARQVAMLIHRADDALGLIYLRSLPFDDRTAIWRQARLNIGPKATNASRRAHRDALRAHRVALARAHGQLPALG